MRSTRWRPSSPTLWRHIHVQVSRYGFFKILGSFYMLFIHFAAMVNLKMWEWHGEFQAWFSVHIQNYSWVKCIGAVFGLVWLCFFLPQGEKILFLLEEDELVEEDFLVYLTEFIVNGSIGHLFSYEESTTIINSIRTEVTQAGLTYTRDVAWEFFLK